MAVSLRNPMTIMKVEEAGETSSGITITAYGTSSGVITGTGFGNTAGKVWLLDRDTHSYIQQPTSSWSKTSITLTTPINRSTIQGNTCFFVETSDGLNSHKFMVYGDGTLTVPAYGLVYVKNNDGTITKITSATTLTNLTGGANQFGKNVTIGGQTVNTSKIVGVQFGSASFSAPAHFLSGMMTLNQPVVFPNTITISSTSTYMFRYNYLFDSPVVFGTSHSRVGNYFMSTCASFNQPLDVSMFKYFNFTYFLQNCYSFNQKLDLPTTLTTSGVGGYFMSSCSNFNQPLKLPTNAGSFGNYFMANCSAFNQPLDMSGVTGTGNNFMNACYAFNQPITIKQNTTVGTNFLTNCRSFNSVVTLPASLTIIPANFMNACYAFNKPLDVSHVKSFNASFLANCYSFDQPLNLAVTTTIATYFLQNCSCYSQNLVLPSTITSIGANFCIGHYPGHAFTVASTAAPSDSASLANTSISTCGAYLVGHVIYGSARSTWLTNLPNSTVNPYRTLVNGGS